MPAGDVTAGRAHVREALARLGIRRFVLGVHASAFPPDAHDAGYGAPLSPAGQRLLAFAAALGFDALQLGPAGQVSTINLSPYDGSVFARNPWSLGLSALASEEFAELLDRETLERCSEHAATERRDRVNAERAQRCLQDVLDVCHRRYLALASHEPGHPLVTGFDAFRRAEAAWLAPNALYEVMAERIGDDPALFEPAVAALFEAGAAGVQRRAAMRATLGAALERRELAQYLCHAQHARLRARAKSAGLALWGDLQVGYSHRDRFLHRECFARGWYLGAPPSRTNPHGQPWGYPLLDPDQLDAPDSPARRLFALRMRKMLAEYDGMRIDHPHGLVCPWVYRASDSDPYHAVRHGARAFESPDDSEADLQRWAIARHENLGAHAHSRFADDWVRALDDAQVRRYARLFDAIAEQCQVHSAHSALAVEVLSTCPYPLGRVLARHQLGRFRVTQKADPDNPRDVYRTELAEPADWLMLGTHDTPPIYALAEHWVREGGAQPRAAYLAQRLIGQPSERAAAAASFARDAHALVTASLADLFRSRAEHVYVFVGDLFGEHEPFNRAGVVHPDNWTARLPEDFERVYSERVRRGQALDIAAALRLACSAPR